MLKSDIDPASLNRLGVFIDLLRRWNSRINLIAPASEAAIWRRHVLDSAQLASLLPVPGENPEADIIDLGSGAGFPGLVLAIITGRLIHLVEADHRKAAFLREAIRVTSASAVVHVGRAESLLLPRCAIATARAVAGLSDLLELAAPLLRPNGVFLFPKGRTAEAELTHARRQWHMHVERFPSHTDPDATIFRLREVIRANSIG